MQAQERKLTLYTDKRKIYWLGIYDILGGLVEQTSSGWDVYIAHDSRGKFLLKVVRGSYTIK